jgi:two-component system, sensor histidine kinase
VNSGNPNDPGKRILLLVSTQRDAGLTRELLDHNGIPSKLCKDAAMLHQQIRRGVGAVLVSEESLAQDGVHEVLIRASQEQPRWSDLPVLIMTRTGADSISLGDAIRTVGNVTLLERPMRVAALVTSLRSALRGRERQYQLRDHIVELERARDAEAQAARRKDEFLAMLAHELRNPLAPVRNALHVLMNGFGDDPARREQLQAMMSRQVDHMVRLVDDLVEVSRLSRGIVHLQREHLDLRDILRNATDLSQPLIDSGGQSLELELPDQPLSIDADPVRIAQVFGNLLNNAAKYSGQGDRIELSARREGGQAVVRVRDSGMGIDTEVLPRVFDLFTQGRRSLPQAQDGLGIGLALVRSLLEMHGGTITAHSDGPGTGAEFVVRLPLASAVARPEPVIAQAPAPTVPVCANGTGARPARVLVVDDNVDAAASLAMVLESIGLPHRIVHDGASALREASDFAPQVVLLDIGMPGMDGYEVARQLRGQPATRDALLVAVTGWSQAQDRRRSREAGFDHHFAKPVDIDALTALLDDPCRVRRADDLPRPAEARPATN